MIVLLSTVALASLLGSLHCAAMCGPLAALAAGQTRDTPTNSQGRRSLRVLRGARETAAYNAGRLAIYCVLGAISGWIGAAVDFGGALVGAQRIAATVAGIILIGCGGAMLARVAGLRFVMPGFAAAFSQFGRAVHRVVVFWPPALRAAAVGGLSGLLPCGWLYAFVLIAGGTANAFQGAATMAAFWLGTLPIMLSLGFGLHQAFSLARARIPVIASLTLIAVGLLTVLWRVELPEVVARAAFARPADVPQSIRAAADADVSHMPCCHGEEH